MINMYIIISVHNNPYFKFASPQVVGNFGNKWITCWKIHLYEMVLWNSEEKEAIYIFLCQDRMSQVQLIDCISGITW